MPAHRLTFRATAETAAMISFAVAAAASGLRSILVDAGALPPSAEVLVLASSLTVGLAVVAAVVLFGELVGPAAGWTSLRRVVRRIPVWLCLVAAVALGVVASGGGASGGGTSGGGAPGDEPVAMFVLSAQLLMITVALVPVALAARESSERG